MRTNVLIRRSACLLAGMVRLAGDPVAGQEVYRTQKLLSTQQGLAAVQLPTEELKEVGAGACLDSVQLAVNAAWGPACAACNQL